LNLSIKFYLGSCKLTEWFTPHINTLMKGSLARKTFRFCFLKFFLCDFIFIWYTSLDDGKLLAILLKLQ